MRFEIESEKSIGLNRRAEIGKSVLSIWKSRGRVQESGVLKESLSREAWSTIMTHVWESGWDNIIRERGKGTFNFFWCSGFIFMGFPGGYADKESACNTGELGLIGKIPWRSKRGFCIPLQYSGLENPMNHRVHGVGTSQRWLSDFHFHIHKIKCAPYISVKQCVS